MAANRQTLAVYGGTLSMMDATLYQRLSAVTAPTLILWGESDGVVSANYGRAYATAIPTAKFQLISEAGHLPQIERPDQVVAAIQEFVAVTNQSL